MSWLVSKLLIEIKQFPSLRRWRMYSNDLITIGEKSVVPKSTGQGFDFFDKNQRRGITSRGPGAVKAFLG